MTIVDDLLNILVLDVAFDVLADYKDGHGPPVKQKHGPNYKRLCPFHREKHPSFYIRPKRNRFVCYGCGENGGPLRLASLTLREDAPQYISEKLGKTISQELINEIAMEEDF